MCGIEIQVETLSLFLSTVKSDILCGMERKIEILFLYKVFLQEKVVLCMYMCEHLHEQMIDCRLT